MIAGTAIASAAGTPSNARIIVPRVKARERWSVFVVMVVLVRSYGQFIHFARFCKFFICVLLHNVVLWLRLLNFSPMDSS